MKKMYRIFFVCMAVCLSGGVSGQTFEEYRKRVRQEFETYRADEWRKFKEYRDKVNAEFAEYMRRPWKQRESEPAVPVPDLPKPPKPVVKDPKRKPVYEPVPFDGVVPAPKPVPVPNPVVPLQDIVLPKKRPTFSFTFYGTPCEVSLGEEHRFALKGTDEGSVADAWMLLSSDAYFPVFVECVRLRGTLRLCDWGYVRLTGRMAESFFPAERRNEARLLQMYLLAQSGYKVRIARAGDRLALLLPSKDEIFEYTYLNLEGGKYYVVDKSLGKETFHVFEQEFPEEQFFSVQLPELSLLDFEASTPRKLTAKGYPDVSVDVSVNRNLMDFYNDYPKSRWDMYVRASLDEETKEVLYPALRKVIGGMGKPEAAGVLLNFVQTAFDYKTDEEQFGVERSLFPDETLYYPYSDCEDRSILFSTLVRELLGLEVILLYYDNPPAHLATAVCFGVDVPGDYFTLEGKKYVVSDPTYINAGIGETMPQYKGKSARITRIGTQSGS